MANTKTWVDKAYLLSKGIPDKYIRKFVTKFEDKTRKLGTTKQAKRLYWYEAVNQAIDEGLITED